MTPALLCACLLVLAAGCAPLPPAAPAADSSAGVEVDHHVHVLSPELVRDWKSLGVPFSRPDLAYTSASAIFGSGDSAQPAFLVSMAHVYSSEEFREALDLSAEEEHARVRLANDHVAREVARAPERFAGFCSVHPLRPYAAAEIDRCRRELGLAGLKLHLPSSGVEPGNPQHLKALADIARRAEQERRPLLVHLAAFGAELSQADLDRFIDEVVRPHPGLELYLAHLGGDGGYRSSAQRVVRTFTRFFRESEENERRPIYFELSGVLLAEPSDGVPASLEPEIRQLALDLRELGLRRVLFGSDYPVFDPAGSARFLQEKLPLSPAELHEILARRAPALIRAASSPPGR